MPYNKNSGFPIVAASYSGNKTDHCCGTASWDSDKNEIDCGNFKSVSVPSGTAIPGVAGLSVEKSQTPSPSPTVTPVSSERSDSGSNKSRETAIGAGVGASLGFVALVSILWALWERRARLRALSKTSLSSVDQPFAETYHQPGVPRRVVELGASDVSELGSNASPKSNMGS